MTTDTLAVPCPCGGHVLHLSPDKPPVGARAAFTCPACGQRRTFVRTADGAIFDGPEQTGPKAGQTPPVAPSMPPGAPQADQSLETPPPPYVTAQSGPPGTFEAGQPLGTSPPPGAMAQSGANAAPEIEPIPRATAPSAPGVSPAPVAAPLPEPRPVPPGVLVVMTGLPEGLDPAWEKAINGAFPAPDWQVLPAAGQARQIEADVRFHRPAAMAVGNCPAGAALLDAVNALPGRVREAMTVLWVGDLPEGDPLAAFRARADATLAAADTAEAEARLTRAVSRRLAQHSLFAAS